ncbi:glucosamine--fructose-6-phosphate aminotransferase (isomerizing) [Symbiobacterium terraclitae]|uniref:Glutamine--fructose-6-phosphate aminotransferase [isomerizing] n=1 Tax=Symbiobacterium terraclitae TaxID=557451 RepID=A0ABS4JT44_9FIRM|nr:glutamine--fructose-6-phosphate transaminase (isomerizing) [Symbiobacterium terraclitae]MBP2018046.1 glucosamine--fructose-6-phosphate aminotransferase (isomerizing) [Symbiobacterium terraclitae]
MCGIVGYIGEQNALPILIDGLKRLEYRGYDSAGVAVIAEGETWVEKSAGRLSELEARIAGHPAAGRVGIGHTRWATHGRPSDMNAHPHTDASGRFAVVHNGIIENYAQLREELQRQGHVFRSETDTEVIPHLIAAHYAGDIVEAVRRVVPLLRGAFALAVVCQQEPEKIVAVKAASPLVIGLGEGETLLASDIPALLPYTRQVIVMEEGWLAVLTREGVSISTVEGKPVLPRITHVDWDPGQAERGGYAHFMLKEIHEQPRAMRDTLSGRLDPAGGRVLLHEVGLTPDEVKALSKVAIVACGTAANAGLVGKYLIERLAQIPVEWDLASEYRYREPMIDERTLFVAVSQSGETADTLAAMREARSRGARILAVTNVVGSTVAREADWVLYTWAGPEIAVASTKAYTTQLVALTLLAIWLGQHNGRIDPAEARALVDALRRLPDQADRVLALEEAVKAAGEELARHNDAFFIGRNLDYAVAMEGQLKLKEISYIHAEAYAAGELKHGTLALITDGVPVVALNTQPDLVEKTISNIQETRARGAFVLGLAQEGDEETPRYCDRIFYLPRTHRYLMPALAVLPLQLLAYYAATARGTDVDKPRNLAKSVTVE